MPSQGEMGFGEGSHWRFVRKSEFGKALSFEHSFEEGFVGDGNKRADGKALTRGVRNKFFLSSLPTFPDACARACVPADLRVRTEADVTYPRLLVLLRLGPQRLSIP